MPGRDQRCGDRQSCRDRLLILGAAGLLLLFAPSCSDDETCPACPDCQPPIPSDYDLVFDGEAGGQTLLFRAPSGGGGPALLMGSGFVGGRARSVPGQDAVLFTTGLRPGQLPQIMVYMLDQVAPFPLLDTQYAGREAVVSQDGTRLAFAFHEEDDLGDIWTADWDPRGLISNLRNLTPRPPNAVIYEGEPAWSPDGSTIAFTSSRSGLKKIWLMKSDGTDARELLPGHVTEWAPAWSPDGAWIAFEFPDEGESRTRIGLVRPDGSERFDLPFPGNAMDPAWSPDSRSLALASNQDGDYDLYVVNLEGQVVSRVSRPGHDRNPAWIQMAGTSP